MLPTCSAVRVGSMGTALPLHPDNGSSSYRSFKPVFVITGSSTLPPKASNYPLIFRLSGL